MSGKLLKETIIPAIEWFAMLQPLIDNNHELKISPSGMSMYPFLVGRRDQVFLRSKQKMKPIRGDIVLFSRENGLHVLHRVHHVIGNEYFLLGDAQTWIEGPIVEENIRAIATAVVWRGKRISCKNRVLRLSAELWMLLRPIRPLVLRIISILISIKNKFSHDC